MAQPSRSPLLFAGALALLLLPVPARGVHASGPPLVQGSGWFILTTQNAGSQSQLDAADALSPSDVWAVGSTGVPDFNSQTLIEHWNGRAWSVVPHPTPAGMVGARLLGVSGDASTDVWAVGRGTPSGSLSPVPLVLHWNGSAWRVVDTPPETGAGLQAVSALSPTDVWAVGDAGTGTLAEHWNGQSWSVIPTPNVQQGGDLQGVTAVSSTDVWAVGSFFDSAFRSHAVIEHWNGTSWAVTPSPSRGPSSSLVSVSAVSANNVWAVGQDFPSNVATLAEHWNGTSWTVVPGPTIPVSQFSGVASVTSTDVWAVGSTVGQNGQLQTLAERWNGSGWTVSATPAAFAVSDFLAVTACATAIFAVGDAQRTESSPPRTLAEAHAA